MLGEGAGGETSTAIGLSILQGKMLESLHENDKTITLCHTPTRTHSCRATTQRRHSGPADGSHLLLQPGEADGAKTFLLCHPATQPLLTVGSMALPLSPWRLAPPWSQSLYPNSSFCSPPTGEVPVFTVSWIIYHNY